MQLTEEQLAALKRLAARRGVSVSELVRQAVDAVLRGPQAEQERLRRERARAAAGRFRSGLGDLAEAHDRYLLEDLT
ncbi:ribbon-helix-helix domain-containing protein [Geochorda subterranea]|uniref:CopG family transcriptional regulator n=1 Tax=Geochorda subterranea TaxID=3109564 RepID=A0ABZ1BN53_9FIRM|nr:CopG family transcriptional regulator [Limnochorda sp. LNt]WRP13861.1 CopG family transcriptional regulator [Limnochorda sp. LNt]